MKIFQMDGEPRKLEFTNYERVSELQLFNQVLKKLKDNPGIVIVEKQILPSQEIYYCSISGSKFILFYDINYGPSVYVDDPDSIKNLIEYFD
ncbi:MAG: hypothetical protein RRZ63_04895 [Clostridium sp.]